MASHLVRRRWFSPYGVILFHPCGARSTVEFEDALGPSYGGGEKCSGCVEALHQMQARSQAPRGVRPRAAFTSPRSGPPSA